MIISLLRFLYQSQLTEWKTVDKLLISSWHIIDKWLIFLLMGEPKVARFPTPNCWHEQNINISSTANWYWQTIDILLPGLLIKEWRVNIWLMFAWCFHWQMVDGWCYLFWGWWNVDFLLINCWCFVDVRKKCWHFVFNLFH